MTCGRHMLRTSECNCAAPTTVHARPARQVAQDRWPSAPDANALRAAARVAAAASLLLAMVACRTVPTMPVTEQSWDARRTALQSRETFELHGRVAVASGTEGFNAKLRWEQSGKQSNLALDGPLGVGGVRVSSDGTAFSMANSKGEQLNSDAARAELTQRLGFEPPLASLRYWVQGVPDPSQPAQETLDDQQRLAALQQSNWQITYDTYQSAGDRWLPQKLTLRSGPVRVRLIVDSWGD